MAPDPKRSLKYYSGLCDEKVEKAVKFLEDNKGGLTARTMPVAETHSKVIKEQFFKMEKKWQDEFMAKVIDEEDDDLYEQINGIVKAAETKVEECADKLDKALKDYDLGTGGASVPTKATKLDNSFKPDPILTFENNLEEFNAWSRSFVAHYDSNKEYLGTATEEIRRQFLNNCIDAKLQASLIVDDSVTMATRIEGDDGLIAKLKSYILRDLPVFIRRYHYSNCKQGPKETFGSWWTRKQLKAAECDLETVKKEDLQVTELICGISDPKLREEILKMKDPKLPELVALGHRFDTAAKLQKNNFSEDTMVNKVQSDYKRSKNVEWQKKGKENDHSQDCDEVKKKCPCCGKTHNLANGCWLKGLNCSSCGEKGHLKAVCPKNSKDSKSVDVNTVRVGRCIAEDLDPDRLDGLSKLKAKKAESSHPRGGKGGRD